MQAQQLRVTGIQSITPRRGALHALRLTVMAFTSLGPSARWCMKPMGAAPQEPGIRIPHQQSRHCMFPGHESVLSVDMAAGLQVGGGCAGSVLTTVRQAAGLSIARANGQGYARSLSDACMGPSSGSMGSCICQAVELAVTAGHLCMGRIKPLRSWKLQYLPASDLCMGISNMS